MSELYARVLLWHKLVAQVTGGLALCSAKRTLPREEAGRWLATMRNVGDDIEAVLARQSFVLDDKGQRLVGSTSERASAFFDSKGEQHVAKETLGAKKFPEQAASANTPRAGGLRIAKRKQQ